MRLLVLLATVAACSCAPQMIYPITYASGPIVAHAQSLTPAVTRLQKPGIKLSVPTPIQYIAPVQVATHVQVASPAQVAGPVQVASPVQVAGPVQVATPVQVTAYQAPVVVAAAPEPLLAPEPPMPSLNVPFVGGQFHSQDEAKQYSFGHWGGPNTRVEVKDSLGRVSGSFAYVNPDGDVHVRKYAAAPNMGFKVAASDLPEDTPAVAMVKAAHLKAKADTKTISAVTSA